MKRILTALLALAMLILPGCGSVPAHFFDIIIRTPSSPQEETMTQQEFFELLPSLAKNAVAVNHTKSDGTAVGQSKFGGSPDLPAGFDWPVYHGMGVLDEEKATRPLTFMAQFNLAEVHPHDTDSLLPASGMLYFFYDMETMRWGYDPDDRGCCRVYYHADTASLSRTSAPDDCMVLPERALSFDAGASFPCFTEIDQTYRITWEDSDPWDAYDEAVRSLGGTVSENPGMNSRLLGYPELIQNAILEECELASTGTYTGSGFPEMSDEERADLAKRSEEWILLFQMGSVLDGKDEIMFGDLGSIFFCIRREDLAKLDFDNVWLILQCG